MLRTSLQSHPAIHCFGEVFNRQSTIHGFPTPYPKVPEVIDYCKLQPQLTGFVAHAYIGLGSHELGEGLDAEYRANDNVKTVTGLWQAIPDGAQVITLWRRDFLARYVSKLLAQHRSIWGVRVGQTHPPPLSIRVDCQMMLLDFARIESLIRICRNRFPNALVICYEELVDQFTPTLERIQTNLGVPVQRLTPDTEKIGLPITETIENLEEVRQVLIQSRFEGHFDSLFLSTDKSAEVSILARR